MVVGVYQKYLALKSCC